MSGASIRQRLEINRPDISDAELERAALAILKFLRVEQRRAGYWMDAEQFEVEADVALWKAARSFDRARKVSFTTHAVNWMRWTLGLAKRPMMPLGLAAVRHAARLQQVGEEPGGDLMVPISLNADPDAQDHLAELAVYDEEPEEAERLSADLERILPLLEALPAKQQRRVGAWLRNGTYRAAARECGLTGQGLNSSLRQTFAALRSLATGEE